MTTTVEKEISFLLRGRLDIMANILNETVNGAKKTRIMYRCNLSFKQLQAYLKYLKKKGFLEVVNTKEKNRETTVYQTTKKGLAFLEAYQNLKELIST
ncbi:MAG: winged helix-turn-helix domain-containing protein [Candidatus Bathyarchaeia archaeon]